LAIINIIDWLRLWVLGFQTDTNFLAATGLIRVSWDNTRILLLIKLQYYT
jgi:hypothetical protein